MTNLLPFAPPVGVERFRSVAVHVDAVVDGSIVARMVREVRQMFRHIVGGWQVTVKAAATLPVVVVEKLQSFLRESAAAFRPLPI